MKKREQKLCEKANISLDLSGELAISGVLSIECYSEEKIELSLRKNRVIIVGERMTMTSYYPDDVRIFGRICALNIEEIGR